MATGLVREKYSSFPPIAGSAFESSRLVEKRSVSSDKPPKDTQAAFSVNLDQNLGNRL